VSAAATAEHYRLRAVLRIDADRLGTVAEVRSYLEAVDSAYNGLYALNLIVTQAKQRASENEPMSWRSSGRQRRVSLRTVRRPEAVVLPEDRLQLRAIVVRSPGSWDFLGALSPLESLRKYVSERHERRKDREYRESLEAERMSLENARLKTAVVREQVELLRSIGVPEEKIREALTALVVIPLVRLDTHQDASLILGATLVDEDEPPRRHMAAGA